jgi:hypothetical protein
MVTMALGRRGQWANCKHLYFIFIVICRLDAKVDDFIYAPCFSFNEVKGILVNEILNHKSLQLVTKRGSHLNSKEIYNCNCSKMKRVTTKFSMFLNCPPMIVFWDKTSVS